MNRKIGFLLNLILILSAVAGLNQGRALAKDVSDNKELFITQAGKEKVLRLGLVDCIIYALKNNSDINITRIEPRLREEDIIIAESVFSPRLTAGYNLSDTKRLSARSLLLSAPVSFSRNTSIDAGLHGKLITGTGYSIEMLNRQYKSNEPSLTVNPYYTAQPRITITQPVFKNFGIQVNKADIAVARNRLNISQEIFKGTVMDIVSQTKAAYYNYLYRIKHYSIAQSSLQRAESLLKINQARYDKGLLSSVDLLETEAARAQRSKALIGAESELKKAEDELKVITNLVEDPWLWNADLELIDSPEFYLRDVDLADSLKTAFEFRPDYAAKKIELENRDIKIKVAENSLWPEVDIVGSFALNGLGGDYGRAARNLSDEYKEWAAGIRFSIPLGGADRARYDREKLEKARELLVLERLEHNIIMEVRQSARQVGMQYRTVLAAEIVKEKESRHYQAQQERYSKGHISTHDILEYQERLAAAELEYIGAVIDYNLALIGLDRVKGLTLAQNNIILED